MDGFAEGIDINISKNIIFTSITKTELP